jgi:hypothetical protein
MNPASMILLPDEHKCKNLRSAKHSFDGNYGFKSIDGTKIKKSMIAEGVVVRLEIPNRERSSLTFAVHHNSSF